MDQMTLTQAVNEISQALAELETAKEDCNDVVQASLDAHLGDAPEKPTRAIRKLDPAAMDEYKKTTRSRKTEAKNIVKLAKAMLKGEKDDALEEAENMTDLIESLEGPAF